VRCLLAHRWREQAVSLHSTLWPGAALKRAGIEDFRWHDLRHTWASWHVQAGTPSHALQELGGWEYAEMVRKYAHLSSDHLAEYADRMSGTLKLVKEDEAVEKVATI
jgi:integrase